MRRDILEQHVEEAAFLYRRLQRSHRVLDGNARQARSLLARVEAHVDALALFADPARAMLPPLEEARDVGERFVATALAALDGRGLEALGGAELDHGSHAATRDALLRYGRDGARAAVDAWLAGGGASARALGVELLAAWGDPRAAKVATRAVTRGDGALRVAGLCALAALGKAPAAEVVGAAMDDCPEAPWRDALFDAVVQAGPAVALEAARRWAGPRCDMAWVILGVSGEGDDLERLLDAFTVRGAVGALPAALALAGAHGALDAAWEGAALPASNALREAAYVVLGGEAPPVVLRDDTPEEPEDVSQRVSEDSALRTRMSARPAERWRWGVAASVEGMRATAEALGPRHARWCHAALAVAGAVSGPRPPAG